MYHCSSRFRFHALVLEKFTYRTIALVTISAGISILTSNQITVVGVTVMQTGGDGIYVGLQSNEINISSVALIANYRNAMSVTGVVGLIVENSVLMDTKGTCCMVRIAFDATHCYSSSNTFLEWRGSGARNAEGVRS